MSNTTKQASNALLIGFGGLVIFIVLVFFYLMVVRGTINAYQAKGTKMQTELKEMNTRLEEIKAVLAKKEEIDAQAETIRKVTRRLPSSPDAPGFLNSLVMALGTTGIVQEEVKPDKTTEMALYTEIPYDIKAFGHYHSTGQFLTLIEQSGERFMRVKNLKITNNPSRPSVHPVEMQIATFMFTK